MPLSDELDVELIEREARAQLEEEHKRRLTSMSLRKAHARERRIQGANKDQESAINEIQDRVRQVFYETNDYKRYVDSRGNAQWLLPEDYEWRMKHRKRSGKHRSAYSGKEKRQMRMRAINVSVVVLAILAGLMVLHESM
jgi:hypothetical protein